MRFLNIKILIITTLAILFSPYSYADVKCKNVKATAVVVDMGGGAGPILGDMSFSAVPGSGSMSGPQPSGPKILHVFKVVSDEYKKNLKNANKITAKAGDVFTWGKYPDPSTLKYLCSIDPSLSIGKIKKLFIAK